MGKTDPFIKSAVRSAGLISAGSIIWMLAGKNLAPETWILSGFGVLLWASSEWDWYRQDKQK